MKPILALVLFIAGLVTGTALTYLALRPPSSVALPTQPMRAENEVGALGDAPDDDDDRASASERDDGREGEGGAQNAGLIEVARAEIVDHDSWAKQGFVEMTPPVRLPSDGAGRDKIEVWLRVPEGGRITARKLADGRATIAFPPGTIADRVESWGYARAEGDGGGWKYSVTDVRGTRLDVNGAEMFHVFVPVGPEPGARLVGWEWARSDRLQQRAATQFLISHLERMRTLQDRGRPQSAEERRELIEDYRRNNDCAKCHAHDKPVQTSRVRGIHRATDSNGFYVPLSVLMDTVPLERHRPRDMNVGDPFLTITCPTQGDHPVLAQGAAGAREYRCLQGGSPSGTLDVKKALAANDARTIALCKSRAYLRAHMDDHARTLFATQFADCGW